MVFEIPNWRTKIAAAEIVLVIRRLPAVYLPGSSPANTDLSTIWNDLQSRMTNGDLATVMHKFPGISLFVVRFFLVFGLE